MVVTNKGGAPLSAWSVRLTLPQGQSIVALWNGKGTGTTGSVSVANAFHNGGIDAQGTQVFGFVVNGDAPGGPTELSCSGQ